MPTPSYGKKLTIDQVNNRITYLQSIGFVGYYDTGLTLIGFQKGEGTEVTIEQLSFGVLNWFEGFVSRYSNVKYVPITTINKGLRYNTGKAKWALLDFPSLEPMVRVMEYGAGKYSPHNWKKGMPHTEISECLMRHLAAYLNGEDTDPESGLSHIGHIQSNAMMLQYNIKNHPELDDRYKGAEANG